MADEYQISDSLKELSLLEITGGRKTDRIRFLMVTGTVTGFQVENITEVSGGGTSISGGGSSFLDKQKIKPTRATSAPIRSANRRKCTLWVKSDDDAELQIQFESEDAAFREGHVVRVLCASTNGSDVYYLLVDVKNTGETYAVGEIPMSAVLAFGAEPLFGFGIYAGASFFLALVAGASVFFSGGENASGAVALIFLFFLGLRIYLWTRRQKVQGAINRHGEELGEELAEYMIEHER